MSDDTGGIWDFSLAVYALPGAAEALIALQDRHGRDVNLILFALWHGCTGRGRLQPADVAAAERAVAPLRVAVIEPLRDLRRRLKDHQDGDVRRLREGVKGLELEAEKAAQQRLAVLAGEPLGPAPDEQAAAANLALCLGPQAIASAEAAALREALADFLRSARP